ncbi:hypothetical protein H109_07450, partial [Trichophyton interdigitale MR816]
DHLAPQRVTAAAWKYQAQPGNTEYPLHPLAGMKDVTGQGEASRRRGTAARGTSDLAGRALLGCAGWSRVPFARVLRHSRPGHPSSPFLRFSSSKPPRKRKRDVQGQTTHDWPGASRK